VEAAFPAGGGRGRSGSGDRHGGPPGTGRRDRVSGHPRAVGPRQRLAHPGAPRAAGDGTLASLEGRPARRARRPLCGRRRGRRPGARLRARRARVPVLGVAGDRGAARPRRARPPRPPARRRHDRPADHQLPFAARHRLRARAGLRLAVGRPEGAAGGPHRGGRGPRALRARRGRSAGRRRHPHAEPPLGRVRGPRPPARALPRPALRGARRRVAGRGDRHRRGRPVLRAEHLRLLADLRPLAPDGGPPPGP